jgi:TatD DNase family protein
LQIEPACVALIDIGANLGHESFKADFDAVVERASAANVAHMVVTGSDLESIGEAVRLTERQPAAFSATAGIHPHYADQLDDHTLDYISDLASRRVICAVGETGLDFFRDLCAREVQEQSFVQHIALAKQMQLPMFLHQRDSHERFIGILREHRAELKDVVVHCFTDTASALEDYLALDCHIGITGWICDERRGAHLIDCVGAIPADRLMLESDAPYLMPRSIRPKPRTRRNEPCTLPAVLRAVASARGESEDQLARATTANARRFFSITETID